jgi:hypothetical protein
MKTTFKNKSLHLKFTTILQYVIFFKKKTNETNIITLKLVMDVHMFELVKK